MVLCGVDGIGGVIVVHRGVVWCCAVGCILSIWYWNSSGGCEYKVFLFKNCRWSDVVVISRERCLRARVCVCDLGEALWCCWCH